MSLVHFFTAPRPLRPLALGTGPGSAGRASMAKVIIGGQMMCLLLSLLVTPVTYALFDDLGRILLRRKREPRDSKAPDEV